MKQIYFYDPSSKLYRHNAQPIYVADDWQAVPGATDKEPDFSKRARFVIKWGGESWVYEKREVILWLNITDTESHRERKVYYEAALFYYHKLKQPQNEDGSTDNNPDDLIQFLKDNEDAEVESFDASHPLKNVIKWIEDYEATKF